jgi:2-polyprenyl-3-methyl-5-hydroxy-6-metoxy-1,4-benzoquinol methylase
MYTKIIKLFAFWDLKIRWWFQRLIEKIGLINIRDKTAFPLLKDYYEEALNDACGYIKCKKEDFFRMAEKWSIVYPKLWRETTPREFYKSWHGEFGYLNICANIKDQFSRERVFKAICLYIKPGMKVLDFGAGTGVLSLCFKDIAKEIHFLDVENEAARFLKNRISKLSNLFWHNIDQIDSFANAFFDFVICVDVLEHLEEPSEVFIRHIHPKIRKNGILLLTAPWGGGDITHLQRAYLDWCSNGSSFIRKHYRKKFIIGPMDTSGIYSKMSN